MKKLLVDLSALEDIYQGMGNIALNYGKHFRETYRRATAEYDLTLLVPKEYFGQFGDEVKYLSSSNWLRRHCRYFFPKFDIWRNLHHTSRFKPSDKSTIYIYHSRLQLPDARIRRNTEKGKPKLPTYDEALY